MQDGGGKCRHCDAVDETIRCSRSWVMMVMRRAVEEAIATSTYQRRREGKDTRRVDDSGRQGWLGGEGIIMSKSPNQPCLRPSRELDRQTVSRS